MTNQQDSNDSLKAENHHHQDNLKTPTQMTVTSNAAKSWNLMEYVQPTDHLVTEDPRIKEVFYQKNNSNRIFFA
jgi:hypothetical protein